MKHTQTKGFANIILIVVAVILAGALGYVALVKKSAPAEQHSQILPEIPKTSLHQIVTASTPTPVDTAANLKTYTNSQYGFSFKYPAASIVTKTKDNLITLTSPNGEVGTITFLVTSSKNAISRKGDALGNIDCPLPDDGNLYSSVGSFHLAECKNLENANGFRYARAIHSGMSTSQTFNERTLAGDFLNPQEAVSIWTVLTDTKGNILPMATTIFDSILQSFKFINQQTSATHTTENWETYTNTKYNYQIKYPSIATVSISDPSLGAASDQVVSTVPGDAAVVNIVVGDAGASISICYPDCGSMGGMGIHDLMIKELVIVNGKPYTASGVSSNTKEGSYKLLSVNLQSLEIRYGYRTDYGKQLTSNQITEADGINKQILSTFKFTPPVK